MSTTTYSSNNVLNAVAAAAKVPRRAQGGSEPPERVPGARRRHRHEHVAHHPVGGEQRGEPSHRCLRAPTSARPSPPAPSWVPAATPASSPPRSCAAYARAARASTSSTSSPSPAPSIAPARWPSRPCASRWKARSSRCCAIPPPPPRWPSSRSFSIPEALDAIVAEAYASVQRTPDLLPVLKEHGVVDAGGFGLAILFDAFTAALLGRSGTMVDEMSFARGVAPQGGDRAGERLGGLPVPLLQRVPRGFRYPGQGCRA